MRWVNHGELQGLMKKYLSLRESKERLQAIPETGMWSRSGAGGAPGSQLGMRTGVGETVGSFWNTLMGVSVGVAAELIC